jgi:hypothetical protein
MKISKVLCWFGCHNWQLTLNFVEPPDYSLPFGDHYGSNHYNGVCRRCGKRDLFSGPYDPEEEAASHQERNAVTTGQQEIK